MNAKDEARQAVKDELFKLLRGHSGSFSVNRVVDLMDAYAAAAVAKARAPLVEALQALLIVSLGGPAGEDFDPEGWAWNELSGDDQERVVTARIQAHEALGHTAALATKEETNDPR